MVTLLRWSWKSVAAGDLKFYGELDVKEEILGLGLGIASNGAERTGPCPWQMLLGLILVSKQHL